MKNNKARVRLCFCSVAFFGQFNKIHVFPFSGPFRKHWKTFSGWKRSRKISRIKGKKIKSIAPQERFQKECITFIHVYIIFCKFDVVLCLKDRNCRQLFSFILYPPNISVKLFREYPPWNEIYLFQTGRSSLFQMVPAHSSSF